MAVIRYSTFDKTVQTIIDRNNISNKVDGMTVVVLDAISDINAGPGKAVYRWESTSESWILVSKVGVDTISFATEELLITNGKVVPSNIALDNQIWNVDVIEGSLIVAQPRIEDLYIDYTGINGLSEFNGKKLRFTYAYGTVSVQMSSIIQDLEEKIENFEGSAGAEIDTTEYKTGVKRSFKDVYGIEVPLGNLPDTSSKEVDFIFNPDYSYWIDGANSYAASPSESITLPYSGFIGDDVSVRLDRVNNKILVMTAKDRSSFVGNLVLLYTK